MLCCRLYISIQQFEPYNPNIVLQFIDEDKDKDNRLKQRAYEILKINC